MVRAKIACCQFQLQHTHEGWIHWSRLFWRQTRTSWLGRRTRYFDSTGSSTSIYNPSLASCHPDSLLAQSHTSSSSTQTTWQKPLSTTPANFRLALKQRQSSSKRELLLFWIWSRHRGIMQHKRGTFYGSGTYSVPFALSLHAACCYGAVLDSGKVW